MAEEPEGMEKQAEKSGESKIFRKRKPELLLPAGSLEVLKTAIAYGADAVYIGGEAYGLRAKAKNFSPEDMETGIAFARANGAKVYVTANIFAHNADLPGVRAYFEELKAVRPDALIISDPGVFLTAREICPEIDIHISTQANNTNAETFRFWRQLGAKRVVAARELTLAELTEIRGRIPADLEMETFVHGAMCISYSGRCLLSNYFTGRDANRGSCTHPCRWKYAVMEETRPGEYLPVEENERGTFLFNSKDLCMIGHIPALVESGIDSFKIEGRMKNALYVASAARTYRRAIDDYRKDPALYKENLPWYLEQISDCTHREFSTGFFFGRPDESAQIYGESTYVKEYTYLGCVLETAFWQKRENCWIRTGEVKAEEAAKPKPGETGGRKQREAAKPKTEDSADDIRSGLFARTEQKNKCSVGETIEIMKPDGRNIEVRIQKILDENGCEMPSAPHARQKIWILTGHTAGTCGTINNKADSAPQIYDLFRRREVSDAEESAG